MLNRLSTAAVRVAAARAYQTKIHTFAMHHGHGTVYGPASHEIVAFNFGSSVRPDVAPISVSRATGAETVESFLARGGRIVTGAPKVAKGASLVRVVKSGTTRVRVSRG